MTKLFDWNEKPSRYFIGLVLLFTILIYYLLRCRYVMYNGDDAWTLTRVYHFLQTGRHEDTIFRAVETDDRTKYFNLTYNYIFGYWLNFLGWTKSNAHLLCNFFVGGAAIIWFHILKHLKFSNNLCWAFALTFMLFPAYYGTANLIRVDPMTFFCASATMLLFIKGRYFISSLVFMLGMESHAMGGIAAFYVLPYMFYKWDHFKNPKLLLKIIGLYSIGILIGVGYYLYLHQDVVTLERLQHLLVTHKNKGKELPSYLITYFIQPEWYMHVWELFLLLGFIITYFVKGIFKQHRFVWMFLLSLVISTFILSRPNRAYMVFVFPAFQLMILYTAQQLAILKPTLIGLLLIFTIHYGTFYWMNRSYHFEKTTQQLIASIPDKNIPVVGMADVWFAVKDHEFHLIYNSIKDIPERNIPAAYVIQNDYMHPDSYSIHLEKLAMEKGLTKDPLLAKRRTHYLNTIAYFKENYECKLLESFVAYRGAEMKVWYCER